MNAARRKRIAEAIEILETAKALLDEIRDEEQDAFDGMPESLQGGERGERMEEGIENLNEVIDGVESAIDTLGEVSA